MLQFPFSPRLLTAAVVATLFSLTACDKAQEAKPETITAQASSTSAVLHSFDGSFIDLKTAVNMTSQFQLAHPNVNKGQYFGRDLIVKLLEQPNAVGIRIYNAENNGQREFVLVGAEANNTDQFQESIVATGPKCPTCCARQSPFYTGDLGQGDYKLSATDGSIIPLDDAKALTERFRANHPELNKGQFYGKEQVLKLLAQSECTGLRIYNAQNEGQIQYVLVGTTQANFDLNGLVLASGPTCPTCCAIDSPLNE